MELNTQQRQLIERYLSGQLTGTELEDFNRRRKEQLSFSQSVDLHEWLHKGIDKAYHKHYEDLVMTGIRYRKPIIPTPLKYIFLFLAVMVAGSTLWFYLAPDTGRNGPVIAFPQKDKPEQKSKQARKKTVPATIDETNQDTATAQAAVPAVTDSLNPGLSAEEAIVVRKDEMLIAFEVNVTDVDNGTAPDKDALSQATAEKLSPASGLPEPAEARPASMTTEFWVSPVNYQGYRLFNNKLILFGIEEPDKVKLYRVKDFLYMIYQNGVYKLVATDDFVSYQRVKDNEVPLALRSGR